MGGLFNPEGKLMRYGAKLWDMMWLNVLVLLCSIPIVTMGPALAAMHYVLLKIYRDEENGITKLFFKSFRQNLRQGVVVQLVFLVLVYLLVISLQMFWAWEAEGTKIIFWLVVAVTVVVFCTWLWTLILLSRYDNSILNTVKSALAACMVHPFRSLFMGIIFIAPGFVLLFTDRILILVLVLGFTGPGLLHTLWYDPVFKKLEGVEDQPAEAAQDEE